MTRSIPLYHWSPSARRKQIIRYGLRPSMRPSLTTPGWRAPHVCFADSPSWAWSLSGGMPYAQAGDWDLWQTWSNLLRDIDIRPTDARPSGIYEARTPHRVYKRDLWYVATRLKPATQ